jgi:hypothetical protein
MDQYLMQCDNILSSERLWHGERMDTACRFYFSSPRFGKDLQVTWTIGSYADVMNQS